MIQFCKVMSRSRSDLFDSAWYFFCGYIGGSEAPLWWFLPGAGVYLVLSISSYIAAGGNRGLAA